MYIGTGIGNTRFICKLEDIQLLGGGADVIKRQGLQSWLVYIVQKLLFCGTMNYEKAKYFFNNETGFKYFDRHLYFHVTTLEENWL